MNTPTQDQLLNAAIMLDGAHPAVAAWLVRMAKQPAAEPISTQDDPCPGCQKGGVCKTPTCGRLKLPPDHPFRSTQQAAKPVAWMVMNGGCTYQHFASEKQAEAFAAEMQTRHDLSGSLAAFHVQPLYTHPAPAQQPLTDEQINDIARRIGAINTGVSLGASVMRLIRAIEAAHGITGSKEGGAA